MTANTQRFPCPPNCPKRSVSCHKECQAYIRYKLLRLLENKRRARIIDEIGFHRDVRKAVEKKHERCKKNGNR